MKVVVYAICKDEEKFVERWVNSMKEADDIYVLDTGSSDNTVEVLKKNGVNVKQKFFEDFRFDDARNESLKIIDKDFDIYVCTDLDEVFAPGWRKKLESIWKEDTSRCRYLYNWVIEDGISKASYYLNKIHTKDYIWKSPVHEYLVFTGSKENVITTDEIVLNHYPNRNKSRSSYLPLLELAYKENPDERNTHYLGREYMYYKRYNEAIDLFIKHVKMANYKEEKGASMRFISRCYIGLNRIDEALMWLDKAIELTPELRDPYMEKALLCYQLGDLIEVKENCLKALEIKKNNNLYINEVFSYNETVYDLLSICYYYEQNYNEALKYVNKALEIAFDNERIINNKKLIENKINSK